jgi:tetratricopeptide (TPR) repeat protein
MRFALLTATLALALASSSTAEAQFNPQGRNKKPHPAADATPARPAAHPPRAASKPTGATTAPKSSGEASASQPAERQDADGSERHGDRDALIARYLGAALAQPGAEFPIQRLVELYRERDGKLDALIAELERRAAGTGSDRYAALLGLAGVERLEGNPERAIESYTRASAEQPKNPAAELALAHLYEQRGDGASARTHFEQALARSTDPADRESILRSLRTLALDQRDFTNAARFQRELEQHSKGSFFVRAELGRELLARGENERAIDELKAVVKAAAGDNRVLAPAGATSGWRRRVRGNAKKRSRRSNKHSRPRAPRRAYGARCTKRSRMRIAPKIACPSSWRGSRRRARAMPTNCGCSRRSTKRAGASTRRSRRTSKRSRASPPTWPRDSRS